MITLALILILILWLTREKQDKTAPVSIREDIRINTLLRNVENYDGTDRYQIRLEDIE